MALVRLLCSSCLGSCGWCARIDEPPSTPGDSYNSSGIIKLQSAIEEMHPGIYIHSVYVDPDSKKDLQATFVCSDVMFSSMAFVG